MPGLAAGGYFALTGKLSQANAAQINNMLAATQKQAQVRLDLGSLTGADDVGARLLADALAQLRKRQYALALQHPEKIRRALESAVKQGREAGEGYWILLLELLQWQNDRQTFEDRAVDFAVSFRALAAVVGATARRGRRRPQLRMCRVPRWPKRRKCCAGRERWSDRPIRSWPSSPSSAKAAQTCRIDLSGVDRIDFVCAGALLNAIIRTEGQRKTVQIAGASPIIRALLLLIGISPRHFVKKAQ